MINMNKEIEGGRVDNLNNGEKDKPVLITKNIAMLELLYKVKLVAKTKATLLITGENGTGKEVMSQLAHYHSNRQGNKLITLNCGAIPHELVESELFGHEKGSFTGAHIQKDGCFEMANQSTLFLDEVSEMSKDIQVKLLRAVEVGSFRRVGGKDEVQVDVRLISATNKNLFEQVRAGNFREDLYYRLNVIELHIPPLRERKEDISIIVDYYNDYFTKTYGLERKTFSEACMHVFTKYDWPGNVRELKNVVERSLVLSEGEEVQLDVIPTQVLEQTSTQPVSNIREDGDFIQIPLGISLEEVEKKLINKTLSSVSNNKTEAAKILGVSRKTLHNKLDKYDNSELESK